MSKVIQILGGKYCSLVLLENGSIVGWGSNYYRILDIPPEIQGRVIQIAMDLNSGVIALLNNGMLKGWGSTQFYTTRVEMINTYLAENDRKITQIAVSDWFGIGLLNDGTIKEWSFFPRPPTPDFGGLRVTKVACEGKKSLVLLEDGTLRYWYPKEIWEKTLTLPDFNGRRVIEIASRDKISIALLEDGTIRIFGDSSDYLINKKLKMIPDFGGRNIVGIDCGVETYSVILDNNTIIVWGKETYGLPPNDVAAPTYNILDFSNETLRIVKISSGATHLLILLDDGSIRLYSKNDDDGIITTIPRYLLGQIARDYPITEDKTFANYQELKQKVECPQCRIHIKKVLLNCNHALCETCSSALTNCPVCAKIITSKTVFHKKYYKF